MKNSLFLTWHTVDREKRDGFTRYVIYALSKYERKLIRAFCRGKNFSVKAAIYRWPFDEFGFVEDFCLTITIPAGRDTELVEQLQQFPSRNAIYYHHSYADLINSDLVDTDKITTLVNENDMVIFAITGDTDTETLLRLVATKLEMETT